MAKKTNGFRKLRKALGLRQDQFWPRIGVTQSGGSRYENGREAPKPVRMLLVIAYGPARDAVRLTTKMRTAVL